MTLVKQSENCKNCDSPLIPNAEYCARCGAQVIDEPFTFKYVKDDFAERFLQIDNNLLLRTIKDMFLRPEVVIRGYIDGVRKRHLRLSNYLAIAITVSGLLIFALQKYFPGAMDMSWMLNSDNPMFRDNPALKQMQEDGANAWWMEYQAFLYIINIPIYALLSKLTFYNQKAYSYLKHMVIVGYSQAHISIVLFLPLLISIILGYNYMKMSWIVLLIMFLYSCFVYKRIFNLSLGQILGRVLLFFAILIGLVIIYMIVVIAFVLITGVGMPSQPTPETIEVVKDSIGYITSSAINWTS